MAGPTWLWSCLCDFMVDTQDHSSQATMGTAVPVLARNASGQIIAILQAHHIIFKMSLN